MTRLSARIDYGGFGTIAEQDAFFARLTGLERGGGIALRWTGPKGEKVATAVALRDPEPLYRHLRRRASGERVKLALAPLRGRADLPQRARDLVDEVGAAWERGVSRLGLAPHDVLGLQQVIDLAIAAQGRQTSCSGAEVDFRTFSRAAVGNSKALERNLASVARAFFKIFPEHIERGPLRPAELLATLGISRLPQPLLVSGPVALDESSMPRLPYLGVPIEEAHRLRVAGRPPYMLTVENYASFIRHVREVSARDGALVIFSGGFPSRQALSVIAGLAVQARAPAYHWGDMDAGGVRIFHHLERELGARGVELRPHLMQPELLRQVGVRAPASVKPNLANLVGSAVEALGKLIAEEQLAHEQEDLAPRAPEVG